MFIIARLYEKRNPSLKSISHITFSVVAEKCNELLCHHWPLLSRLNPALATSNAFLWRQLCFFVMTTLGQKGVNECINYRNAQPTHNTRNKRPIFARHFVSWSVPEFMTRLMFFPLQWRHNRHDGVSNHPPHDCLLNRLFRRRSKKKSKLRVTGLCAGNSPVTGVFPAEMASNAENVSIWWRHHVCHCRMKCRAIYWTML